MTPDEDRDGPSDANRDDPVADLAADVGDREGDPFEQLADAGDSRAEGVTRPDSGDATPEPASIDAGADREGDPFESSRSAFESMDVGEVDPDDVWEDLVAAKEAGSVADVGGTTYAEVSKHAFCEVCEYFSEPPEVACSHEGTEILEFLDTEHVRLADCPVVAERRAFGEE